MFIYRVDIKKDKNYCIAESKEFDIGCTADSLEKAISLLNGEIIKRGVMLLKSGKSIPESSEIDIDIDKRNFYITVDFERMFRESFKTDTSRRNITLPTWMDYKLRLYGIDASRLFQDAAEKVIEKYESFNKE